MVNNTYVHCLYSFVKEYKINLPKIIGGYMWGLDEKPEFVLWFEDDKNVRKQLTSIKKHKLFIDLKDEGDKLFLFLEMPPKQRGIIRKICNNEYDKLKGDLTDDVRNKTDIGFGCFMEILKTYFDLSDNDVYSVVDKAIEDNRELFIPVMFKYECWEYDEDKKLKFEKWLRES